VARGKPGERRPASRREGGTPTSLGFAQQKLVWPGFLHPAPPDIYSLEDWQMIHDLTRFTRAKRCR